MHYGLERDANAWTSEDVCSNVVEEMNLSNSGYEGGAFLIKRSSSQQVFIEACVVIELVAESVECESEDRSEDGPQLATWPSCWWGRSRFSMATIVTYSFVQATHYILSYSCELLCCITIDILISN